MRTPRVEILGVGVDSLTRPELESRVVELARDDTRTSAVLNVNVHALNLAFHDPELRDSFQRAEVVFCDGAGVRLGAWILGERLPERITYADWIWNLARLAARNDLSLYLLGARPGVAGRAADRLIDAVPGLKVVGVHHGYFDLSDEPENHAVVREINAASPDILLVCLGMPAQERWLMRNLHSLNARVALTGGAALDYAAGDLRRGPKLLTDNGFEWLGRLIVEPRRLWKRYVFGNPVFLYRVMREAVGRRFQWRL